MAEMEDVICINCGHKKSEHWDSQECACTFSYKSPHREVMYECDCPEYKAAPVAAIGQLVEAVEKLLSNAQRDDCVDPRDVRLLAANLAAYREATK